MWIIENHQHLTYIVSKYLNLFQKKLIKTFTVDSHKEFAGYNEIEKRLNIDVYFADPFTSWQKVLMKTPTDY